MRLGEGRFFVEGLQKHLVLPLTYQVILSLDHQLAGGVAE